MDDWKQLAEDLAEVHSADIDEASEAVSSACEVDPDAIVDALTRAAENVAPEPKPQTFNDMAPGWRL